MITKTDILKMVRAVHRHNKGLPDRRLIHPSRDWGLALTFFALVTSVGVGVSGYMYMKYNTIEDTIEIPSSGVEKYDEVSMQRALEMYRNKVTVYQNIKNGLGSTVSETPEIPAIDEQSEPVTGDEAPIVTGDSDDIVVSPIPVPQPDVSTEPFPLTNDVPQVE